MDVVIAGAGRTPMGAFQGALKGVSATELGARAISETLVRAGIDTDQVDEVLMGCVLPAGLGQAPARQAALGAGLSTAVPCATVNKVCGSGMKTVMLAYDMIRSCGANVVVAGGMESMSNAPFLLEKARGGYRLGHGKLADHLFLDGLEDAYDKGRSMGTFAEDCAEAYQFTRQMQDDYAIHSLSRAENAISGGMFLEEIFEVNGIASDEGPSRARPEKIPHLRPAFKEGGTVTAANSSSISDGAAAVVLTTLATAEASGHTPLARMVGYASHAQEPALFTTAPIFAINKLLDKIGWTAGDVDLWEINEAFAVVAMAAMRDLGLPHDRVNVNGGACALGHPIGASGTRILVTLLAALKARGLSRGVASLCIGGGEATAIAVELIK